MVAAQRVRLWPGRFSLSGFVTMMLLAFLALPASAEPSKAFHLEYQGYLGAAPVLDLSIDLAVSPDGRDPERYRAAVAAGAAAALRNLLPFDFTARAEGLAGQGGVRPTRYSSRAALGPVQETALLSYGPDGRITVRRDPPAASGRDPSVSAGERALDPLSAILAAALDLAGDGACRGRFPVFDGVRRYDLSLTPVGPAVLTPSRFAIYAGPATECALQIDYREGFRAADLKAGLYPESVRVWFAPAIEGAPALPVRFAARSALGAMQIDLIAARPAPASPPS